MRKVRTVVAGIANLQTTVPVAGFPIEYEPARYLPGEIVIGAGGVGMNVARVLAGLGGRVVLVAPLGTDVTADAVEAETRRAGVELRRSAALDRSPRSVVLHAPDGRRQVNTDLAGATAAPVDLPGFTSLAAGADAVVLGNVDFTRPLLRPVQALGVPVVVDLQDVRGPDNPYDRDFLAADVLLMSDERVRGAEADVLRAVAGRSAARLVVLTRGAGGCLALAAGEDEPWAVPAADAGPVGNTTGAGDAFTAALTHYLLGRKLPARQALPAAAAAAAAVLARPDRPVTEGTVADVLAGPAPTEHG